MNISDSLIPPDKRPKMADRIADCTLDRVQASAKAGHFSFGANRVDRALGRERLPHAMLHEVQAASGADGASAAAFCLLLAERCRRAGSIKGSIVWANEFAQSRQSGFLYPPGLSALGIDPGRILSVRAKDSITVLRAGADAVRSGAVGAVIIEVHGKKPRGLDMTATRRLALFARESGATVFLLRGAVSVQATAAYSRWQVGAAPSRPMEANAPGHPVFDVKLLRHRRGIEGLEARLEWKREAGIFAECAPDIGAVFAVPRIRKDFEATGWQEQRKRA